MQKLTHLQKSQYFKAVTIVTGFTNSDDIKQYYSNMYCEPSYALRLHYQGADKITSKMINEALFVALEDIVEEGVNLIIVADSAHFKKLTKHTKVEPYFGIVSSCKIKGYENLSVIPIPNFKSLFFNPRLQEKITLSLSTINNFLNNTYVPAGQDVIQKARYIHSTSELEASLNTLLIEPSLACDTETFGLHLKEAKLATIGFAPNQHEGIAATVGYTFTGSSYLHNPAALNLIKEFFTQYKGQVIYHNALFDIRNIIYYCFMEDSLDHKNLVDALDVMYRNVHDTQIITYLATNTAIGNVLGLKPNTVEFIGDYAQQNIHDITQIDLDDLLKYQLQDCLATNYLFNKYYPTLKKDNQLDVYSYLMLPALKNITHMELTGMPMDMNRVLKLEEYLIQEETTQKNNLHNNPLVKAFEWLLQLSNFKKKNAELKKKFIALDEFKTNYNPNSGKQTVELLYNYLGLKVVDLTDTKQPAVGKKTLNKLLVICEKKQE